MTLELVSIFKLSPPLPSPLSVPLVVLFPSAPLLLLFSSSGRCFVGSLGNASAPSEIFHKSSSSDQPSLSVSKQPNLSSFEPPAIVGQSSSRSKIVSKSVSSVSSAHLFGSKGNLSPSSDQPSQSKSGHPFWSIVELPQSKGQLSASVEGGGLS